MFEIDSFETEEIAKIVKRINLIQIKNKLTKLGDEVRKNLQPFLSSDKNSVESQEALQVYITLMDDFPEVLAPDLIEPLSTLLTSDTEDIRLDALILLGTVTLGKVERSEPIHGDLIDTLAKMLDDSVVEIRSNALFFIEELPEEYFPYLGSKIKKLLEFFDETDHSSVIEAVLHILSKLWKSSLSIMLDVFDSLTKIYKDTGHREKEEKILQFLGTGLKELEIYLKTERNISKRDVMVFLDDRYPLIKIYDINKIAQEEKMDAHAVEKNFQEITGDESIFRFFYQDKKKYFVEIETNPLVKLLSKQVRIEDLLIMLGTETLDAISLLNLLVRKLVKAKLIRGYLSKSNFYSYKSIKESMMNDIRQTGEVNLDNYAKVINYDFVLTIAENINKETKFKGIYSKNKSFFMTLSKVMKEIERICVKESICDLSEYKTSYLPQDYELIETDCKKKFFTKFHDELRWLTNIGYTRLSSRFKTGQTVGYINLSKIIDEEQIPDSIALVIFNNWIKSVPGVWDKTHQVYYLNKYIKQKIKRKGAIAGNQEGLIQDLAKDLNIENGAIVTNLNHERAEIINQIKSKPSIDLNTYCRALGMKREEFLNFVNELDVEYLVQQNQMIFDPKQIERRKKDITKKLEDLAYKNHELFIPDLSHQLNFSEHMIYDIIANLWEDKQLVGTFISDDLFITDAGIRDRIFYNKDFVTMEILFPDDELDEDSKSYIITILEKLVDSGKLIGAYENGEFRGEDALSVKKYDDDRVNAQEMLDDYVKVMRTVYQKVKEIYMEKSDIRPGDIKRKDFLVKKRVLDELQIWEKGLKHAIKKAEVSFDSLDDAGEMTFGDILDQEETSGKAKIDGPAVLAEFNEWKQIIMDIDVSVDEIPAYKKRLKDDPENESIKEKLEQLYDKLRFNKNL
ncbi:MAG: HEAT repeat domain-containing protein [Promethearchaeota archaeon]